MRFIYASVNDWSIVDVIEDDENMEERGQELVDALMENVDAGFSEIHPTDDRFGDLIRGDGTKEAKAAFARLKESVG